MMPTRLAILPVLLSASLLAGCWTTDRPAAEDAANAAPTVAPPPTSLSGKWTLSSTGAGSCTMTFGAQPQASEGTIAPAGGCPYSFFTSRKWNYTTAGLIIRDHHAQQLALLTPTGDGRFVGKTSAGQDVSLGR
jgi:predicted small secreted protein